MKIPFIMKTGEDGKPTTISLFLNGKPYVINSSAPLFDAALAALKNNDAEALTRALDVKKALVEQGNFKLFEDSFYYNGLEIKNRMFERIIAVFKAGVDLKPIIAFLDNLFANPSQSSREELYLFLEHNDLPITEDGHFLAYKRIRNDYMDCYTSTIDNSVGKIVTMDRSLVNSNRRETCSHGLHFCSRSYIGSYTGERLVVLKINPRDVVSIPNDYDNAKGRCCEYLVLEEIKFSDHITDGYRPTNESDSTLVEKNEGACVCCGECGEFVDDCTCELVDSEAVDDVQEEEEEVSGGLSVDDVRNIRKALKNDNLSLTAIGKMYGVHRTTIQRIRDGISHVNVK